MTAEIAVMNREAIALAADSAVTMQGEKVFFSANKIFALSRHHPVAAMIYGNYGLMGMPWEPVIKAFRSELGRKSFDTISRYAEELLRFVKVQKGFYSVSLCDRACRQHISDLFDLLAREIKEHYQARTGGKGSSFPDAQDIDGVVVFSMVSGKRQKRLSA